MWSPCPLLAWHRETTAHHYRVNGETRIPNFPEVPAEGLFGPGSMIWKINRERIVLLGGPAAAILQIAHPKVARGVVDHSDFRRDALGRLKRTLAAVYTIAFGTGDDVEKMAAKIAHLHRRVRSEEEEGRHGYSAFDADLQLWVLATLVVTAIDLFEGFVEPLSPEEKQRYLDDMYIWGEFFGLDRSFGPQSWPEFHAYYLAMVEGELLGSDPASAGVARGIVRPERPFWLPWATAPMEFLATEIIPSPLREKLGLRSRNWTKAAWRLTGTGFPGIYRHLPEKLRYAEEYRTARARRAC